MVKYRSMSFIVSSNKPEFKYSINPPIKLEKDGEHEIALLSIDMYHSTPNIDNSNNKFIYKYHDKEFKIIFPVGSYEIKAINDYIQEQLIKNKHKELFTIEANATTLKCTIHIKKDDIKIHFNRNQSLNVLLGYGKEIIKGIGKHEGQNIVKILSVNSILVNCDIIEGSYLNGIQKPVLYSFFPDVPPGYKLNEKPSTPVYLPVTIPSINSIRIWLTDQDHNPLNVRGEEITIRIHLKSSFYS